MEARQGQEEDHGVEADEKYVRYVGFNVNAFLTRSDGWEKTLSLTC